MSEAAEVRRVGITVAVINRVKAVRGSNACAFADDHVVQDRVEFGEIAHRSRITCLIEPTAGANEASDRLRLGLRGIDRPTVLAQPQIRDRRRPGETKAAIVRREESPFELRARFDPVAPAHRQIVLGSAYR